MRGLNFFRSSRARPASIKSNQTAPVNVAPSNASIKTINSTTQSEPVPRIRHHDVPVPGIRKQDSLNEYPSAPVAIQLNSSVEPPVPGIRKRHTFDAAPTPGSGIRQQRLNATGALRTNTPDVAPPSPTCTDCKEHVVQTIEGRYIHSDYLDRYMKLRYKKCHAFERSCKMDKYVLTVPEALHETEIKYLQQATSRRRFMDNYLVPLPGHPRKADTI